MPIYSYRCGQGHETELLRPFEVAEVLCGCGDQAIRSSVNRLSVIGQVPVPRDERSYRKSYGEYREAAAEVADGYERVNRDRAPSEQVKGTDYYSLAKAQAIAKGAPIKG